MEVNKLLSKLKARGNENDDTDLIKVHAQYKDIINNLSSKDKPPFALNVLCTLCRNIDRVPSWSNLVKDKDLLILTIECAREARVLEGADEAKTLAYLFHIHRHIIRKSTNVPPELLLKLSYMPFEKKKLIKEYYKTYWSIIADRMTYIERLKSKLPVTKLLPSLSQDVFKIIEIFDITQFCLNVLSYIIKKMNIIFSESPKELNLIYQNIFECISKTDVNSFKVLSDEDAMDLYVKLNDCLCVIIENASKIKYKDLHLENIVHTCIYILGHKKDICNCFQTFYLNSFCCIFNNQSNFIDMIFNNLIDSCESTENIDYTEAMKATYPFLSQLLRIYIESGKFKQSISSLNGCLQFIIFLLEKLKDTSQLLKCEGCIIKTGLHDALRVTFLTKLFITTTKDKNILQSILPTYYVIVEKQYEILAELKAKGCPNFLKCYKKLQADIHNTAISLHSVKQCEFSIKLFNIYLKNEIKGPKESLDKKSISRALYNKGISELDIQLLEEATKSAYLSMIFALPESLNTQKYMDLVNNIKSMNVNTEDEDKLDELRYMSCLDACILILKDCQYEDLKPFIQDVKFCELLYHEHKMYMQHWPSVKPIAGVCRSLNYLLNYQENTEDQIDWIVEEKKEFILDTLYEVLMDITNIRTINLEIIKDVVVQLLERFEKEPPQTLNHKLINIVLMFMKAEHDISDMADKHDWRVAEQTNILDPDKDETYRNLEMEHTALKFVLKGVDYMTSILAELEKCGPTLPSSFKTAIHVSETLVQELLYMNRTVYALQLAFICCQMAKIAEYGAGYLRNAGVIINFADEKTEYVDKLIVDGNKYLPEQMKSNKTVGIALAFVCESAMYYYKCGSFGTAARIIEFAQARVIHFYQTVERKEYNCDMDMAVGRLMEAQMLLCAESESAPSELMAVTSLHRHYLAIHADGAGWSSRRRRSCALRRRCNSAAERCVRLTTALQLWRRARAAAAAALPRADARAASRLHARLTHAHHASAAQTRIDNRLRFIAGQQPSSVTSEDAPVFEYTPQVQQHETMLFCICGISPSLPPRKVSAHRTQEFLNHTTCTCYACDTPSCTILTCEIDSLEASMYYRAKEFKIARNYFNGALKTFELAKKKLKYIDKYYKQKYNRNVCEIVKASYEKELKNVEIDFLIESSYFELSQNIFDKANENFVRIHEMLAENIFDPYIINEISNLMITAAKLKDNRKIQRHTDTDLEEPIILADAKTPISKLIQKMETNLKIKVEEVPKRLKVIKMNLDEAEDSDCEMEPTKEFKVPLSKPIKIENMTPKPKTKPKLQPLGLDTPKTPKIEFYTPTQSTPGEQFFTPMSSIKTYSRRIVKNLENEFLTPKAAEMNQNYMRETARKRSKVDTPLPSVRSEKKDKKTLVQSTSLEKTEDRPLTRSRRKANDK